MDTSKCDPSPRDLVAIDGEGGTWIDQATDCVAATHSQHAQSGRHCCCDATNLNHYIGAVWPTKVTNFVDVFVFVGGINIEGMVGTKLRSESTPIRDAIDTNDKSRATCLCDGAAIKA